MRVLSLFDGISCGQVALERAGIPVEVYYASEIDKYAIQVTQKNYPNTIQLGDVTKIDFTKFIGKIDILIGGSPCQDLSIAGARKGLSGERSGLFYKFVEALEVIKPKYFLLENNVGMPQEAYEEISRLIGCYPIEINSALVSAQNRRRYYWTNIGDKNYNLFGFPTCAIPQPENKGLVIKNVLEQNVDKKYYLSNKRAERFIPKIGINTWGTVKFKEDSIGQRDIIYNIDKKIGCLTATDYKSAKLILEPINVGSIGKNVQGQRVYSINGKSITVTAGNGGGRQIWVLIDNKKYIIRKVTPLECERLQTLPDNYTDCLCDTQRYCSIGNGWTVDVIAHIFKHILDTTKN